MVWVRKFTVESNSTDEDYNFKYIYLVPTWLILVSVSVTNENKIKLQASRLHCYSTGLGCVPKHYFGKCVIFQGLTSNQNLSVAFNNSLQQMSSEACSVSKQEAASWKDQWLSRERSSPYRHT